MESKKKVVDGSVSLVLYWTCEQSREGRAVMTTQSKLRTQLAKKADLETTVLAFVDDAEWAFIRAEAMLESLEDYAVYLDAFDFQRVREACARVQSINLNLEEHIKALVDLADKLQAAKK